MTTIQCDWRLTARRPAVGPPLQQTAIRAGATVGLVLGLMGCGAGDDPANMEEQGAASDAIMNGDNAGAGWEAIVTIYHDDATKVRHDSGLYGRHCSGALVAPKYVLTAAHCVDWPAEGNAPAITPDPVLYHVAVGCTSNPESCPVTDVVSISIADNRGTRWPSGSLMDRDLAVLELAEPSNLEPLRIVTPGRRSEVALGDTVKALGWGRLNPNEPIQVASTLQELDLEISTLYELNDFDESFRWLAQGPSGTAVCKGDSGGPAVIWRDNEWFVLGVSSLVLGICGNPVQFASTAHSFDWAERVAPGMRPSYLPSAQIASTVL